MYKVVLKGRCCRTRPSGDNWHWPWCLGVSLCDEQKGLLAFCISEKGEQRRGWASGSACAVVLKHPGQQLSAPPSSYSPIWVHAGRSAILNARSLCTHCALTELLIHLLCHRSALVHLTKLVLMCKESSQVFTALSPPPHRNSFLSSHFPVLLF